jgi:hypothetical protein
VEALPRITAAREELERQQAALQKAKSDLLDVRAAERAVRIEASAQYRMMYGELVKRFPHNLRKVRGFFRQERGAKAPDQATTGAPPDAPASDRAPASS